MVRQLMMLIKSSLLPPGGCSRFWYGGCEPGKNHFETESACKAECAEPRGSAVCFLQKVSGPCQGVYEEWYYDSHMRTCR